VTKGAPAIHARPQKEHELAIARIVDGFSIDGRLYHITFDEIIAAMDFVMSRSDSEFLVSYIWWRMGNPIAKLERSLRSG
jgi:hypothetical protein